MKKLFEKVKSNKKAMYAGLAAAFVFVLLCFGVRSVPEPAEPEASSAAAETESAEDSGDIRETRRRNYSGPASSLKELQAAESEEEFVPAPDKLNLAFLYPDDADTSDSIHSYAGMIFTEMNAVNADYLSKYYDLTDTSPLIMAGKLGMGADRVKGKYDPEDPKHDINDPNTWTVNQFKNINVNFYNGDGKRISGYYNAQEIMALASVYAYYHDMDDADAMEAYCRALFENAVSAKVSMGNVYYDDGCLKRTVEQEAEEAAAHDAEAEAGKALIGDVPESPEAGAGAGSDGSSGAAGSDVSGADAVVQEQDQTSPGYASGTVVSAAETGSDTVVSGEGFVAVDSSGRPTERKDLQETKEVSDVIISTASSVNTSEYHEPASSDIPETAPDDNVVISPASGSGASVQSGAAAEQSSAGASSGGSTGSGSGSAVISEDPAAISQDYVQDTVNGYTGAEDTGNAENAENADSAADSAAEYVISESAAVNKSGESNKKRLTAEDLDNMVVVSPAASSGSSSSAGSSSETAAADGTDTVISESSASPSETAGSGAASSVSETAANADGTGTDAQTDSAAGTDVSGGTAENTAGTVSTDTVKKEGTTLTGDNGEIESFDESYCPGHIDMYVSITIKGINDSKGLFAADKIGNSEDNFNVDWQGWTEDKIALAKTLCAQDWFETYGLSISSIRVSSQLTEEEIARYLAALPSTVSDTRKAVVEFALNSVGKVPYYWGGKPAGPGYESNSFYKLTGADIRGRILSGLDCSGWVNWVYWSATGNRLPAQSTGTLIGIGRRISRADLQPGDIIIRTGEDAHVVMFLCWAENGEFVGIHETGGIVNNVTVSSMIASWPYYRALTE